VKTVVEQFRAIGNVTGKESGRSKPRVRTPNAAGTIRASVASSPTRKSVRELAAENVFQSLTTVWREKRTRFAEEFGDHPLGLSEAQVFSSAPRTLPELKERIKESCAEVTRGMLTRVAQNCVLCLQAVRESQRAQH
jgi:hypothetical protein